MRQLLAKAAEAVVEELGPLPESDVANLRLQYRDLAAALAGPTSNGNGAHHPTVELTRDQFNAFRVRFLQKVATEQRPVDGRELARVLASLEDTPRADHARPATNEFTQRLASPDALRAVVEMAHDMRSPLGSILFLVDTFGADRAARSRRFRSASSD